MGSSSSSFVTVVGCGVIGLTSARRLQQAGYTVRIVARDLPLETTSSVAAAIWLPFHAEPADRVAEWAHATWRACRRQAADPESGVRFVELSRFSRRSLDRPFWLRDDIPFRRAAPDELPPGYADGWHAEVPFLHAPRFLAHQLEAFRAAGGTVERREVASLEEVCPSGGVVVNCTGLGAREVVGDGSMFPIRGQVTVVRPAAPLSPRVDDDDEAAPAYVLPRDDDEVVLGGVAQAGDGRLEPAAEEERAILERCRLLEPRLAEPGVRVLRTVVGLRPGRPEVRLEAETLAQDRRVVHNYGHGGSGFTICWGCADEVVARVEEGRSLG